MQRINTQIRNIAPSVQLDALRKVFSIDKRLAHLWKEYEDSLHLQREERDGQLIIVAVRSTTPAELHFSHQYVVDSRLHTDYFKHLPGIFTGLGIIGTFWGLIEGLSQFDISESADAVRTSLDALMGTVSNAFIVSATAIAAAMLATFVEKLALAWLYSKAEELVHAIDKRFESGVGEEYLRSLVKSSEASASQSKILKDALIQELGTLLRELTQSQLSSNERLHTQLAERINHSAQLQVDASREDSRILAESIGTSIRASLEAPLAEINAVVRTASGDQSASAMRLLEDRMASFSQRLSDLFGGQISGLNELNQQTALGVQHAVSSLHTLVARLEESGMRSSSAMAERMAASIQAMEERQAAINSQTQSFVEQIRALVGASQEETQHKLQLTLESIRQQMTSIVSSLGDSQQQALEGTRARETALADRSQVLIGTLTGTVEDVVKELRLLSQSMADSVSLLSAVTSTSVSGMQTGADRIGTAAAAFAAAGDRVNLVLERSADVSAKLSEVSGSLRSSAISVQDALQDYRSQREFIAQMLSGVRDTVELAKKEASLTGDILRRIEQATSKLEIAQKAADEYLDSVNQVLAKSSDAFRQAVVTTLDRVNHDFHVKLRDAVGLLATTIQELETALSALSSAPPQR